MVVQNKIQGRRTQAERRQSAKEALLQAAAELVAEQGVQRSSLADIGERAGYSRGLVNRHFGTKDTLISELAALCQQSFIGSVKLPSDETGVEHVLRLADAYLGVYMSPEIYSRAFLVMWGEAFPGMAVEGEFAEADARAKSSIADCVKRGIADGSVQPGVDIDAFAAALLGMLRGIAGTSLVSPSEFDVKRMREQCHYFIEAALSSQS